MGQGCRSGPVGWLSLQLPDMIKGRGGWSHTGPALKPQCPQMWGCQGSGLGLSTSLSLPLPLAHFIEHLLCSRSFTWIPLIKSSQRPCEVSAIITCFPDEKSGTSRDALQSHRLTGVGLRLKLRLDGQQVHHHDYSTGWRPLAPLRRLQPREHVRSPA